MREKPAPTILFITTHNLATNPRIVKEIRLAITNQYRVKLIAFSFEGWSKPLNDSLLQELLPKIEYAEISASRRPFLPWLKSTLAFIGSKIILSLDKNSIAAISIRSNKRSYLLQRYFNIHSITADLIVAHNPGSLYPAYLLAARLKKPFGVDLEDFHEGESNDLHIQKQTKKLIDFVLPKASYITAASPLILKHSTRELPLKSIPTTVVENYFEAAQFQSAKKSVSDFLKLIWFSQHINYGRGLEKIIPILKNHPGKFELHIYGNSHKEFVEKELMHIKNVSIFSALPQKELHKKLADYDVGLALEEQSANANKNYALSNKILAYTQAGLFILASDTEAQQLFLSTRKNCAVITTLNYDDVEAKLIDLFNSKSKIRSGKVERYDSAKKLDWSATSSKLLEIWNALLR